MSKSVTIKDIAAAAGVSVALVSFVMNNSIGVDGKPRYRVNPDTRDRILEVARRLNYQPSSAARELRFGRSKVIGAILSDISNVFYGEMARLLENMAFARGYTMIFGSTDEDPAKLRMIVSSFMNKGVDGYIIVPCENSESILKMVLEREIPMVILDRRNIDLPVPVVALDNASAMNMAVRFLRAKGRKRIEMISYTMRVSSITEREEGYMAAMREFGAPEEDINIVRVPFDDIASGIRSQIQSIVDRGVDALVFATNTLTIETVKALFEMGVKVQEDIHIVGFDNSDVFSLFHPTIPHMLQPIHDICQTSMDLLFNLIDGKIPQEKTENILQSRLII